MLHNYPQTISLHLLIYFNFQKMVNEMYNLSLLSLDPTLSSDKENSAWPFVGKLASEY